MSRIPPRPAEDFDDMANKVADLTSPGPDGLMMRHYAVLAHNPWYLERWLRMAGTVMKRSSLPEREKMIVMLRIAYRMRCAYAWTQRQRPDKTDLHDSFKDVSLHGSPAQVGLSATEIAAIAGPLSSYSWPPRDLLLLTACDETKDNGGMSTPTWTALAAQLSQAQMFDLAALIGFYLMDTSMFNSFGVDNYPGDPTAPWERIDNGAPA